ncbi:MAG TPA: hypothetical protein VGQ85_09395 [Candidatus Limnocylindrales bacterium]|nr:hypothetical protein [Candidatus Limnocylindrales bacterium]
MGRSGELVVTKECSEYTGKAGDHCTLTASNIADRRRVADRLRRGGR